LTQSIGEQLLLFAGAVIDGGCPAQDALLLSSNGEWNEP